MTPETEKWLAEVMASHTSHTSADKMVRRLCNLVTEQAEEIDELESLRSEANRAENPTSNFREWFNVSNPPKEMDAGLFIREVKAYLAGTKQAVEVIERKRDEVSPVGIGAKVCNEILAELKGEG